MEQAFQKVIFQQPRLLNWCKNHGSETSFNDKWSFQALKNLLAYDFPILAR
jgi:hypothetical protein